MPLLKNETGPGYGLIPAISIRRAAPSSSRRLILYIASMSTLKNVMYTSLMSSGTLRTQNYRKLYLFRAYGSGVDGYSRNSSLLK